MKREAAKKRQSSWRTSRYIFYLLAFIVFAAGIKYVDKLHHVKELLVHMQPAYLLLVILFQTGTYMLNTLLFQTLLEGEKSRISFNALLKVSIVMLFINQTLPSGGLSGYGYLFRQLSRRQVTGWQAFKVVILESLTYYAAFLGLLGMANLWYLASSGNTPKTVIYTTLLGLAFFSLLAILVVLVSNRKFLAAFYHRIARYPQF